ncbi:hypothetical protein [Paracoccus beibuensis]|uniref:hypothetical protein n=1 Tax=Paracoccus beibuensis TaxID=547602 RepID=UPI00223E91E5|nr:hypothetical protein [Paracoccus beibuensis]
MSKTIENSTLSLDGLRDLFSAEKPSAAKTSAKPQRVRQVRKFCRSIQDGILTFDDYEHEDAILICDVEGYPLASFARIQFRLGADGLLYRHIFGDWYFDFDAPEAVASLNDAAWSPVSTAFPEYQALVASLSNHDRMQMSSCA